jgi:hypothetical protein
MSALDRQEGGSHYKGYAIQPVEFIHQNDLGFLEGCVIKRLCRWQMKDGIKDLRKAIHEIELLIEQTEAAEKRARAEEKSPQQRMFERDMEKQAIPPRPMIGDKPLPKPQHPRRECTCLEPGPAHCHCPPERPLDAQNRAPAADSKLHPVCVPEGEGWPVGCRNGTRVLCWRARTPGSAGWLSYGWVEVGFMWDDQLVPYPAAG